MHGRGATLFLLVIAAGCLVAAALTMNWWSKSDGFGETRLGLREAEVCVQERCTDVDLEESPLARAHRPNLLYGMYVGLLAIAVLLLSHALASFARAEPLLAGTMALVCVLGLGLSIATGFVGGIVNVSFSFFLAIGGNVIATIVLVQSMGARQAALEARQRALLRASRAAQQSSARSQVPSNLADALLLASAADDPRGTSGLAKKKSSTGELSLNPHTDPHGSALPFAVRDAVIGESTVRVLLADSEQRTVDFPSVRALYVRMLPQDGPFARIVFLDIVPGADEEGRVIPLRFVPTTRANYGVLPGGAAVASQENFRRLAARILELSPNAELDADTKAFIKENRAPRQFAALSQFAEYEARYAG